MDNYQAIAYMILAMDSKEYSREEILSIKYKMRNFMDLYEEEKAEKLAEDVLNKLNEY